MVIYHTSDLHNHTGFVEALAQLRTERPGLLVDCGDSLRGSQTVYYRREPIMAELAQAAYDVQAMGNREFHYLYPLLCARVKRMTHPLLCSNLIDLKERALPFGAEHRLPLPDGRTLRLFALLVPQYPVGSLWERLFGWRFLDPITVARQLTETATSEEVLVLLSHLGLSADCHLAAALPRWNLILGGHSHDTLPEPQRIGDVPIVHAGPYGRYASRTVLDLDYERPRICEFALLPIDGQKRG